MYASARVVVEVSYIMLPKGGHLRDSAPLPTTTIGRTGKPPQGKINAVGYTYQPARRLSCVGTPFAQGHFPLAHISRGELTHFLIYIELINLPFPRNTPFPKRVGFPHHKHEPRKQQRASSSADTHLSPATAATRSAATAMNTNRARGAEPALHEAALLPMLNSSGMLSTG